LLEDAEAASTGSELCRGREARDESRLTGLLKSAAEEEDGLLSGGEGEMETSAFGDDVAGGDARADKGEDEE